MKAWITRPKTYDLITTISHRPTSQANLVVNVGNVIRHQRCGLDPGLPPGVVQLAKSPQGRLHLLHPQQGVHHVLHLGTHLGEGIEKVREHNKDHLEALPPLPLLHVPVFQELLQLHRLVVGAVAKACRDEGLALVQVSTGFPQLPQAGLQPDQLGEEEVGHVVPPVPPPLAALVPLVPVDEAWVLGLPLDGVGEDGKDREARDGDHGRGGGLRDVILGQPVLGGHFQDFLSTSLKEETPVVYLSEDFLDWVDGLFLFRVLPD